MTTATLERPSQAPVRPGVFRWDRERYHRASEAGVFDERRVELIEGDIFDMAAMNRPHWVACGLVRQMLGELFRDGYTVTDNRPAYFSDLSEPEPDAAVLRGAVRDYLDPAQMMQPVLVVEVSDSSLDYDRVRKASLYARYGVPEYWIVNLPERCVERLRQPVPSEAALYGFDYAERVSFVPGQSLSPLSASVGAEGEPGSVRVDDLMP